MQLLTSLYLMHMHIINVRWLMCFNCKIRLPPQKHDPTDAVRGSISAPPLWHLPPRASPWSVSRTIAVWRRHGLSECLRAVDTRLGGTIGGPLVVPQIHLRLLCCSAHSLATTLTPLNADMWTEICPIYVDKLYSRPYAHINNKQTPRPLVLVHISVRSYVETNAIGAGKIIIIIIIIIYFKLQIDFFLW
jgi:hypothetical protein